VDHAHNHYLPGKYLSRHMNTNAKTLGFGVFASKAKQSRAVALTVDCLSTPWIASSFRFTPLLAMTIFY
jgi:hypothetical protein